MGLKKGLFTNDCKKILKVVQIVGQRVLLKRENKEE